MPTPFAPAAPFADARPGMPGAPTDVPDDGFRDTLPAILRSWARGHGTEPALTFLDHRGRPHVRAATVSWRELDRRTGDLAAFLRRTCRQGDRAALLMEQGIEFAVAFLGVLRAGLIAVPLLPPDQGESREQVAIAMTDADPAVILTTAARLAATKSFVDEFGRAPVQLAAIDALPPLRGALSPMPEPGPDDLACLQYEPGSAGRPAAVMYSHTNLVAGARQAGAALGVRRGHTTSVNWLPLFQHLGLMLGLVTPLVAGTQAVLMHPAAFHEDPLRWLRALADYPGAIGAAPNAAYGRCVTRTAERDRTGLRLDRITALADVGTPTRPEVAARFTDTFTEYGLPPHAYRPCYGLPEATALVAASGGGTTETSFYRAQLALGHAVPAFAGDVDAVALTAAGTPLRQQVCVVDPRTRTEVPEGTVGEIWVSGPNVARGYWRRSEASAETFCVLLAGSAESGEPCWWLRTGDLGVLSGAQLYVTGRVSDVVRVDGRSHYPQDVEATAEAAHPAIAPHQVCVFTALFGDGPRAVLAAERASWVFAEELDGEAVAAAIRRAVAVEHGLALREVLLLAPGVLPRTIGGTAERARCRDRYLTGALG